MIDVRTGLSSVRWSSYLCLPYATPDLVVAVYTCLSIYLLPIYYLFIIIIIIIISSGVTTTTDECARHIDSIVYILIYVFQPDARVLRGSDIWTDNVMYSLPCHQ